MSVVGKLFHNLHIVARMREHIDKVVDNNRKIRFKELLKIALFKGSSIKGSSLVVLHGIVAPHTLKIAFQ